MSATDDYATAKQKTEALIANRLRRRTFAATFFLANLAAIEREGMRFGDL